MGRSGWATAFLPGSLLVCRVWRSASWSCVRDSAQDVRFASERPDSRHKLAADRAQIQASAHGVDRCLPKPLISSSRSSRLSAKPLLSARAVRVAEQQAALGDFARLAALICSGAHFLAQRESRAEHADMHAHGRIAVLRKNKAAAVARAALLEN